MKFSYQWLKELVSGLDTAPEEVERLITIHTAESEGIERHGDDFVIEVDNKSLTHRPDLWGHHGMARELAALTGKPLRDPVEAREFPGDCPYSIEIQNFALCPRYSALVLENATVKPSPDWLVRRLEAVGLNPINNIVDVTNYVLAEIAQPMHAFDAAKLHGDRILVRPAAAQEPIQALNGESYQLDPSNLVIADSKEAIAIAGVIGGGPSSISASTTRIVLESANFNATNVRKTSARLKLRTDASQRFEKAQDPANTVRGLQRAVALLEEVSPGIRVVGGLGDSHKALPEAAPIRLPLAWLAKKLGREIPAAHVRHILESLAFGVTESEPGAYLISVPSWRATKDISIKEDLVEEVGRIVGYGSITPAPPLVPAQVPVASPQREFHHRVREMVVDQGFTEVYNYSFVSEEMVRAFSLDPAAHVQVANPIAADQSLLRTSLLPGIWKNVQDNLRHFDQFRFFEIGREIFPDGEVPRLAACIVHRSVRKASTESGAADVGQESLLELKRLAQCLLTGVSVRPAVARPFEHPERVADVVARETVVGRIFEFHPAMVEHARAGVLHLNLELLEQLQPGLKRYVPLRRYPASAFDLSIVVPARSLIADIQQQLQQTGGDALISVEFLRDFPLPGGERSLSYRVTMGANDRTLSTDEVTQFRSRLIEEMRSAGFELRV